jgi:integrase
VPRKPSLKKQTVLVKVNETSVAVTFHPPSGTRKAWYAYWPGLVASKSTGQQDFKAAVAVVEGMLRNAGRKPEVKDTLLTDDDLEAIQRSHFDGITDPDAKIRAAKSLEEVLAALSAFKAITGLKPISLATPDDCAAFQRKARTLPKNWRAKYPNSKDTTETLSPNTILKWSRCLASSFERANRNAGKKCVRGVVPQAKLLTANPWTQFTWIEGPKPSIRQFDVTELLGLLSHVETTWSDMTVAAAALKVFLWSGCRKLEVAGLTWDMARVVGDEFHFEIVGKWGVERWFRVPEALYQDLHSFRSPGSTSVFAAYTEQIRHRNIDNRGCLKKVRDDFTAENFGRWIYERVKEWAEKEGKEQAYLHVFRKTALQHARRGEDINRQVAADARVGERVLMTNYVKETDDELRARSNRTYDRILASLPAEVACRYGHAVRPPTPLEEQLGVALAAKDWERVAALSQALAEQQKAAAG